MKFVSKLLLLGAVAFVVIAISAVPSEAAKKKAKAAKCELSALCAANCKGNSCDVKKCDIDGQWRPSLLWPVCLSPNCPPKC